MGRAISCYVLLAGALCNAQSPKAFEVVSVRPIAGINSATSGTRLDSEHLRMESGILGILRIAFETSPEQIFGPSWMRGALFEIQATLPLGAARRDVPEMLRSMLAERFHMTYHRERRNIDSWVVTARSGAWRLQEADSEAGSVEVTHPTGNQYLSHYRCKCTLNEFGRDLFLGRPFVNQTGRNKAYLIEFDTKFTLPSRPALAAADSMQDILAQPIMTGLESLGLRVDRKSVPVDVIVIDNLDRQPTEN